MTDHPPETTWAIPAITRKLPDGSTLVLPGKAIQRATVSATVKITGVPAKILHRLAECGLLTRELPSPFKSFFYPGEVQQFLKKTAEEPGYWDEVKTKAFLTGKDLRNSKPR
jgi:hypothetical protein